ncbi:MAG: hypothetical protein ABFD92_03820 [Planctomycetaceae bacterium]|nr:hypothetical protein [Planctomycetaceae bacterium]
MASKILWIEDDQEFLRLGCRELITRGFDVLAACDNDEAMELLRRYGDQIGLIIQNIHRPPGRCLAGEDLGKHELTGLVFLARCARRVRPYLPCIFITGTRWGYYAGSEAKRLGNCLVFERPVLFGYLIDTAQAMILHSV